MNLIDIILLIPCLWFGYQGFNKGLVVSMATLLALGIAIWAAIHFSDLIAHLVRSYINEEYEGLISFSIIFIGVVILVMLLGKLLEKTVNMAKLSIVDKIGGAAFGVCKVLLIVSVVFMIFERFDKKYNLMGTPYKEGSMLYYPVLSISGWIIPSLEDSETFKDKNEENPFKRFLNP
jgi:membrane protein required for colicin V production